MNSKIIVLHFQPWESTNKETGVVRRGASITYLSADQSADQNGKGYAPVTVNVSSAIADQVQGVPGMYDAAFRIEPPRERGQQPSIRLASLAFKVAVQIVANDKAA